MNPFVRFLASGTGRVIRIVAGLALIAWGAFGVHGAAGVALGVVGVVPLVAGLFDFCVFAPLFRMPLSGQKIRAGR
ncbi:MAG: YgaP-like transmembrane domain [Anaerolineae bacterium]